MFWRLLNTRLKSRYKAHSVSGVVIEEKLPVIWFSSSIKIVKVKT